MKVVVPDTRVLFLFECLEIPFLILHWRFEVRTVNVLLALQLEGIEVWD